MEPESQGNLLQMVSIIDVTDILQICMSLSSRSSISICYLILWTSILGKMFVIWGLNIVLKTDAEY